MTFIFSVLRLVDSISYFGKMTDNFGWDLEKAESFEWSLMMIAGFDWGSKSYGYWVV
jgi:hypothetical protein